MRIDAIRLARVLNATAVRNAAASSGAPAGRGSATAGGSGLDLRPDASGERTLRLLELLFGLRRRPQAEDAPRLPAGTRIDLLA